MGWGKRFRKELSRAESRVRNDPVAAVKAAATYAVTGNASAAAQSYASSATSAGDKLDTKIGEVAGRVGLLDTPMDKIESIKGPPTDAEAQEGADKLKAERKKLVGLSSTIKSSGLGISDKTPVVRRGLLGG